MMATFSSIMVQSVEEMSSANGQFRLDVVGRGCLHVVSGLLVENLRVVALMMDVTVTLESV